MSDADNLRAILDSQQQPVCAALTPFEILDADTASGFVKLAFAPQPAFGNHFGHIQGGFAVAMLDVALSLAAFVKVRGWLPTVEIKCSFLAPAKLGACISEARVIRAGRSLVFLEGKLCGADGELVAHATATARER